jgi:glycosyltransferase involved in cell wall biosynthesis
LKTQQNKSNSIKLSIITVNLNNAKGLENTIKSVINQTSSNYEFIVIDGGSTDESTEIIEKYSDKINYWVSESDSGLYNSMNKGILRATGDYCYFLNSGDIFYDSYVYSKINQVKLTGDIVCFDSIVNEGHKNKLFKAPTVISFYTFYIHTILHQATLIKRSLFEKYGLYNEKFKVVSDWEFFVKALILGNCSYQSIELTISVFDTTGVSSNSKYIESCRRERQQVFDIYLAYFIPDYNLIQTKSIYNFLGNLKKYGILRHTFLFMFRVINKIIRIFS